MRWGSGEENALSTFAAFFQALLKCLHHDPWPISDVLLHVG